MCEYYATSANVITKFQFKASMTDKMRVKDSHLLESAFFILDSAGKGSMPLGQLVSSLLMHMNVDMTEKMRLLFEIIADSLEPQVAFPDTIEEVVALSRAGFVLKSQLVPYLEAPLEWLRMRF